MRTWTNQLWEKRDQICPAGVRRGSSRTAWRCWRRQVWADTGSKTSVSGCPPSRPLSVNGQSKILSSTESYGNIVLSPDIVITSKVLLLEQHWCNISGLMHERKSRRLCIILRMAVFSLLGLWYFTTPLSVIQLQDVALIWDHNYYPWVLGWRELFITGHI